MIPCILLNADYSFLNVVDWKRAMRLMIKDKVEVLSYSERIIRNVEGLAIKIPTVMKLVKFIRTIYRSKVPFSKRNVLIRDGFKCAYCRTESNELTIDHIVPKRQGGASSFDNCVASCRNCNSKKGARTPREAGMVLSVKPYQPTISEFLRIRLTRLGIDDLLKDICFQ
ncbi:MAG: HNH endonuclease [Thermodesulfobacteriota bacterium]